MEGLKKTKQAVYIMHVAIWEVSLDFASWLKMDPKRPIKMHLKSKPRAPKGRMFEIVVSFLGPTFFLFLFVAAKVYPKSPQNEFGHPI